ncbi:signal peptidase I [Hazenella sp. IB182357]|uniref:Signal peptidase I n=1 Tax=Polycladospora coralii TaxID=2771432 RepID=A0A926N9J9_9BACL|nr:signal peptidase I [Polycladospora coralii]MBD1371425.1 signal peptidase I [Polycladospora coralii]
MRSFIPRSEHLKHKRKKRRREWWPYFFAAMVIAILVRLYALEPYDVSGDSMQKNINSSDLVMINKFIYHFTKPTPNEVIVFQATKESKYIKRVIAVAGQTVEAENNKILVDGDLIEEPYLNSSSRTTDFNLVEVPAGHVFVLGDNRMESRDSRHIGTVSLDQIIGRAELIYWPLGDMKFL